MIGPKRLNTLDGVLVSDIKLRFDLGINSYFLSSLVF